MKSSKTAPEWAVNLMIQVCADYNRALPKKFQWFNRSRQETCGHVSFHQNKLHVAAGKDDWQHKPVLLHELAHWIMGKTSKGRKAGHNKKFWQLFWELNETYGSLELAYERDVKLAREWRPNTRAWAVNTYPGSI